jgi:hypothetical protein
MKTVEIAMIIFVIFSFSGLNKAMCQWTTIGNNIYNTNPENVGIGNNAPTTLLHVAKLMTEPTITVQNLGGTGGATYTMMDQASGANWKFKATNIGGFKIRDHANLMDVITIEPNSFANAIYIKTTDNIGMGTATPDNSAVLDISSTTKGVLIPRMTQAQISAVQDPADGLQVYCTTDGKLYIYVAIANLWKEVAYGSGTIVVAVIPCGSSFISNHLAGEVAPVSKTVTYGTVNNIPGEPYKCWITSNLGADHQATAIDDATEESAGWYWQFNRQRGYKHDGTTRTPNTTWISSINENSDWLIANDPCALLLGDGWRLPTLTEWSNVSDSGGWTTANDAWNSALKLHSAGALDITTGSLIGRGYDGIYWSSSQYNNSGGWNLNFFFNGNCSMIDYDKAYGFSARCLKG